MPMHPDRTEQISAIDFFMRKADAKKVEETPPVEAAVEPVPVEQQQQVEAVPEQVPEQPVEQAPLSNANDPNQYVKIPRRLQRIAF